MEESTVLQILREFVAVVKYIFSHLSTKATFSQEAMKIVQLLQFTTYNERTGESMKIYENSHPMIRMSLPLQAIYSFTFTT